MRVTLATQYRLSSFPNLCCQRETSLVYLEIDIFGNKLKIIIKIKSISKLVHQAMKIYTESQVPTELVFYF